MGSQDRLAAIHATDLLCVHRGLFSRLVGLDIFEVITMAYMRLGDLLVASGMISQEQLEQALKLQKETKQRLGDVLVSSGIITEQHLI